MIKIKKISHSVINLIVSIETVIYYTQQINNFNSYVIISMLVIALGINAGANAPDWLEIVSFRQGKRMSLIKHRTWTHYYPLWIIAGVSVYFLVLNSQPFGLKMITTFLFFFILGSILHIFLDMFSVSGVPFITPNGRSVKIPFYKTGKKSEFFFGFAFIIITVGILYMLTK